MCVAPTVTERDVVVGFGVVRFGGRGAPAPSPRTPSLLGAKRHSVGPSSGLAPPRSCLPYARAGGLTRLEALVSARGARGARPAPAACFSDSCRLRTASCLLYEPCAPRGCAPGSALQEATTRRAVLHSTMHQMLLRCVCALCWNARLPLHLLGAPCVALQLPGLRWARSDLT